MMEKVNRQQFIYKSYTNEDFDAFLLEKPNPSIELSNDSSDDSNDEVCSQAQDEDPNSSLLKKRGKKCYKKEQKLYLKKLKQEEFLTEGKADLESKLAQFIKPQNQRPKYRERFSVAKQA